MERLVNVPAQVVPPMYKMLLEEMAWALEEKEPYDFTHYLVVSKTYLEVASLLEGAGNTAHKSKKQKKTEASKSSDVFFFHPEDEILQKHAVESSTFDYKTEAGQSDSKRAFQDLGIKAQGSMILIEAPKFTSVVKAVDDFVGQS